MLHSSAAASVVHRAPLLSAPTAKAYTWKICWRLPAGTTELPPVVDPHWGHEGAHEAPAVEYSQTGDAHSTPLSLQLDAVQSPQQADAWLQALQSICLWWNGRLL